MRATFQQIYYFNMILRRVRSFATNVKRFQYSRVSPEDDKADQAKLKMVI